MKRLTFYIFIHRMDKGQFIIKQIDWYKMVDIAVQFRLGFRIKLEFKSILLRIFFEKVAEKPFVNLYLI